VQQGIRLIADAGRVVRSVALSSLATALAVYAMVFHNNGVRMAVLGAIVLVVAVMGVFQVSQAVEQLRSRERRLRQSAARAEQHYFKVLRRLLATVEARENYTRGRSKRIGFLLRRMGEQLGLDECRCKLLGMIGQVHDIGLLAVPDKILNKPSRLGTDEFRTVKKHAEISYGILEPLTFLSEVLPAVRHHHERMNGTGYPRGLKGDQIPLSARMLAVADAYDAMTHDRPHRPAVPAIEALNELRRCAPDGYDPRCVDALEEVLNLRHLGQTRSSGQQDVATASALKDSAA